MANKKISELNPLLEAAVAAADLVAVADISANETRKVTVPDLAQAGIRLMPDGTIDGSKITNNSITAQQLGQHSVNGGPTGEIALDTITADNIAPDAIGSSELADGAVDTASLQDKAVTGDKVADNTLDSSHIIEGGITTDALADKSVTYEKTAFEDGDIPGAKITDDSITSQQLATNSVTADELADLSVDNAAIIPGSVTGGPGGSIAQDTITALELAPDSVGAEELADLSVDTPAIQPGAVTGAKLDPNSFDRGIDLTAEKVGITNSIIPGSHVGLTWNEQGLITAYSTPAPGIDVELATESTVGVVSVPAAGGLAVTGAGAIGIANTVTAATGYKITYDNHGLVTGSAPLDAADLPIATETTLGAVKVPGSDADGPSALTVSPDGDLTHTTSGVTSTLR